mgnify:CR=1 FL=1
MPQTVARAIGEIGEQPMLRRLLARGRPRRVDANPTDALVGQLLGAAAPGAAGPIAAGLLDDRTGYWSLAGGCHLIADRDRLMVQAGPAQRLTRAEADAISTSFNAAFSEDGWQLHAVAGQLLLQSAHPLPASPVPLHELSGHYLDDHLPGGAEARSWRALLNELQMLLFEHPVNQAREEQGMPPINGLWFWGCGEAIDQLPRVADCIAADHGVLRGLARLSGAHTMSPVERLSQLDPGRGDAVAHWTGTADALAVGDATEWLSALARFEQCWAQEILAALDNGSWSTLRLHVAPGRYWRVRRNDLRCFWRRVRPLRRYVTTVSEGA